VVLPLTAGDVGVRFWVRDLVGVVVRLCACAFVAATVGVLASEASVGETVRVALAGGTTVVVVDGAPGEVVGDRMLPGRRITLNPRIWEARTILLVPVTGIMIAFEPEVSVSVTRVGVPVTLISVAVAAFCLLPTGNPDAADAFNKPPLNPPRTMNPARRIITALKVIDRALDLCIPYS
jgi:hypothetical protein